MAWPILGEQESWCVLSNKTRKIVRNRVNISRLKLYVQRDDNQAQRVAKKTRVAQIKEWESKLLHKKWTAFEETMHARNMWRKPEENY